MGFYGSNDLTNSVKALKEAVKAEKRPKTDNQNIKQKPQRDSYSLSIIAGLRIGPKLTMASALATQLYGLPYIGSRQVAFDDVLLTPLT